MYPTLKHGDTAIVVKHWPLRFLRKNQIALIMQKNEIEAIKSGINLPSPFYIKRITGLPNEFISIHITELSEIFKDSERLGYDNLGYRKWFVPSDHYFVKSDNKLAAGFDSLTWGPLHKDTLVGIVVIRLSKSK